MFKLLFIPTSLYDQIEIASPAESVPIAPETFGDFRVVVGEVSDNVLNNSNPATPTEGVEPSFGNALTVSGSPSVGSILSANIGSVLGDQPITVDYQWQANTVNIPNARSSTYIVTAGDLGKRIRYTVTLTNSEGTASSTSNEVLIPAAAPSPISPVFTNATFTDPTTNSNAVFALFADYAGSDTLEYQIETSGSVSGATIETFSGTFTSGAIIPINTTPASDANVSVIRYTVSEVNNGGSASGVIENVSLETPAAPPPASPEYFTYEQNGQTSGPVVQTTNSYPTGGYSLYFKMKGDATQLAAVFGEADRPGEMEVSVNPSVGRIGIRSRQVGGSTIYDETVEAATPFATDADGNVEVLIHYINDSASTVASATNRVEVYVNGSVFDPQNVWFDNTNWLTAGDNRSRNYAFFRDLGFNTTRGPADFNEVSLWWGAELGSGSTPPSADPHLQVIADSAGPFTSPYGGNYRVFDDGVERTS